LARARPPQSYRPTTRTRRRYIAAKNKTAPLHISRVVLFLLRQIAALPALANCNGRYGAVGNGSGTTIKYLRRTTSGAAGNGLGTMMKYLR
jgi:hypothetical protein